MLDDLEEEAREAEGRQEGRDSASWLATNWFLVAAEISRPRPSAGEERR